MDDDTVERPLAVGVTRTRELAVWRERNARPRLVWDPRGFRATVLPRGTGPGWLDQELAAMCPALHDLGTRSAAPRRVPGYDNARAVWSRTPTVEITNTQEALR